MPGASILEELKYPPCVGVGNWFEDLCLEQQKIETFRRQRETIELLVEKTRTLFDNFNKKVESPRAGFNIGCTLQVIPSHMNVYKGDMRDILPAVSVFITERVLHHSQKISAECELTAAPAPSLTVRNKFRLVIATGQHHGDEPLRYGQLFCLECIDTSETIYLCCAPVGCDMMTMKKTTFKARKSGQFNLPVGLIKNSDNGPGKMMPRVLRPKDSQ